MRRFMLIALLFISTVLLAQNFLEELGQIEVPDWEYAKLRCFNECNKSADLNNDGYDDYIFRNTEETGEKTYLFMGRNTISAENITCHDSPWFFGPYQISWAGDLNNDGLNDIVYAFTNYPAGNTVKVVICFGDDEFDVEPDIILNPSDYSGCWGFENYHGLNGDYDFNGDGISDLVCISEGAQFTWEGLAQIFFGGDNFDAQPDFQIVGEPFESIGNYCTVGDLNGDGFDDLIVSKYDNIEIGIEEGETNIYLGGINMDTNPDFTFDFISSVISGSDFNGDGFDDLIAQERGLYLGNENLNLENPISDFNYGFFVNINNDQYDDIIQLTLPPTRKLEINLGNSEATYSIYGSLPHDPYSSGSFSLMGDINNDGEDEILVNNLDEEGHLTNSATIYGKSGGSPITDNIQGKSDSFLSNYPNPFNPETTIRFQLPKNVSKAELEIFNNKGQLVKSISVFSNNDNQESEIKWNGKDTMNKKIASGVYLYRIKAKNYLSNSKKMLMIK